MLSSFDAKGSHSYGSLFAGRLNKPADAAMRGYRIAGSAPHHASSASSGTIQAGFYETVGSRRRPARLWLWPSHRRHKLHPARFSDEREAAPLPNHHGRTRGCRSGRRRPSSSARCAAQSGCLRRLPATPSQSVLVPGPPDRCDRPLRGIQRRRGGRARPRQLRAIPAQACPLHLRLDASTGFPARPSGLRAC